MEAVGAPLKTKSETLRGAYDDAEATRIKDEIDARDQQNLADFEAFGKEVEEE